MPADPECAARTMSSERWIHHSLLILLLGPAIQTHFGFQCHFLNTHKDYVCAYVLESTHDATSYDPALKQLYS